MKFKGTELSKLLGTANDKEQVEIVRRLMQPAATISVHYDARDGSIGLSSVGGKLTFEAARMILNRAIEELIRREQAQSQAEQPASVPAAEVPPVGGMMPVLGPKEGA